ncbi:MAG: hypothetical protein JSR80_04985 [Verrucomicrobia bacterium]|nr:hypothetical protein [Verrucomicrobiota bacterium]
MQATMWMSPNMPLWSVVVGNPATNPVRLKSLYLPKEELQPQPLPLPLLPVWGQQE